MNKIPVLLATVGIVCGAGLGPAQSATVAGPPLPVASAASAVTPAQARRERTLPSPPVRAAQGAVTPGDLRPENPVVPQISVPLRRPRDTAPAERGGPAAPGGIDDSAARCRAASTDRERAACIRSGSVSGSAPKR